MNAWLAAHAAELRLLVVIALLLLLWLFERLRPRRHESLGLLRRARNLGLATLGALLVYLLLPLTAIAVAQWAAASGIGAFNLVAWPAALEFALVLVLLDLAIYWQHRWFHEIRALWPIHRVHHSDIGFDTTTGLRFHPLEIMLSLGFKFGVIMLLGASPASVACYEILLVGFALFGHANLRLPTRLDGALRWLLVTPDWHRVHHSVHRHETDSNYGNILTLWDRAFGSARAQPRDGHTAMGIGLTAFRSPAEQRLAALMAQPLRRVTRAPNTDDHSHA